MPIVPINTGTAPNDGTGDTARAAFTKINDNFADVDARLGGAAAVGALIDYGNISPPSGQVFDFNTDPFLDPGIRRLTVAALTGALHSPVPPGSPATIITLPGSLDKQRVPQLVFSGNGTGGGWYRTIGNPANGAAEFSPWIDLDTRKKRDVEPVEIPSSPAQDLNTYLSSGYFVAATAAANAALNTPAGITGAGFSLWVDTNGSSGVQRLVYTSGAAQGREFVRARSFSTWGPSWQEVPKLDANGRLPYRTEIVGGGSPATAPNNLLRAQYQPINSSTTAQQFADYGFMNFGTASVSTSTRYLVLRAPYSLTQNTMLYFEMAGYCHSLAGSNIDLALSYFVSAGSPNSYPSLQHYGRRKPPVFVGLDDAGLNCIIIDRNGLSWTSLVAKLGVAAHNSNQLTAAWMDGWSFGYVGDISAFTLVEFADTGPDANMEANYARLSGAAFTGAVSVADGFEDKSNRDTYFSRSGNNATPKSLVIRKARGTEASPSAVLSGDRIAGLFLAGHDGGGYNNAASWELTASGDWSAGARPSRMQFQKTPATGSGRAAILEFDAANTIIGYENAEFRKALSVGGTLNVTGATFLGEFTQATLPTPSASRGAIAWCEDSASGPAMVECDGTEWVVCKNGLPVGLAPYMEDLPSNLLRYLWRLPNGVMIQRLRHTATGVGGNNSVPWGWNFLDGGFVLRPNVTANFVSQGSEVVKIGVEASSTTGASGFTFNRTGQTRDILLELVAIGTWK